MSTNQSNNLRPCPFCGKKPNPNWTDESYIECTNRKCSVYGYGMSTGDWNTRPIEDELRKRIAELEAERRWRIIADGEMPDDRATVLVAFTEYPEQIDILTATYYKRYEGFGGVDNRWDIEGWHSGNVTHWKPLPESPNDTQTETFVYGKESEE